MLIPWWLKLAAGAVLASIVLGTGYKIGSWKEAASGAEALQKEQAKTTQCKTDLAAQREADLSGANHALSEQLRDATTQASKDAESLSKLADGLQRSTLNFAANTRALYEIAVGTCNFTPDYVRLLNNASAQANAAYSDSAPAKAPAGKTDSVDAAGTKVPDPSHRPR